MGENSVYAKSSLPFSKITEEDLETTFRLLLKEAMDKIGGFLAEKKCWKWSSQMPVRVTLVEGISLSKGDVENMFATEGYMIGDHGVRISVEKREGPIPDHICITLKMMYRDELKQGTVCSAQIQERKRKKR